MKQYLAFSSKTNMFVSGHTLFTSQRVRSHCPTLTTGGSLFPILRGETEWIRNSRYPCGGFCFKFKSTWGFWFFLLSWQSPQAVLSNLCYAPPGGLIKYQIAKYLCCNPQDAFNKVEDSSWKGQSRLQSPNGYYDL